jgi:hypothetical protein
MLSERTTGETPEEQFRRACAELSHRLRCGDDCRAEQFFDACPSLASRADHAVELIYIEFITRRELGQNPEPAEWYERFPKWRVQLESRLQTPPAVGDSETPDRSTVVQSSHSEPEEAAAKEHTVLFGRYEIIDQLGRGGMGVVYQARDIALGRTVALKMIRAGVLAEPQEIERFYREARAAALFQHPHIITLHDVGQEDDRHYYTMALAPGGSLAKRREWFAGDPAAIAALVEKIARAVHFAHSKGILHRDLKPGNILLDEHGEPLVSDFGLAKFLDADAELTQPGAIIGTPAYMAPEQARGLPETITAQSDVWSLGVLLYELLTGQRPFAGRGREEVSRRILHAEPERPRTLRPGLDRALESIVLKCLEKEPARRYDSAEALANDLARWSRGEQTIARPTNWLRWTWQQIGRHPVWSSALFLAVVSVVILSWVALTRPPAAPTDEPGKPIMLLSKSGLHQPIRWLAREGKLDLDQPETGVIRLQAKDLCLLELRNQVPWERYRFEAEVKDDTPDTGGAGIYLACTEQATDLGGEFWFCTLSFAERGCMPARPPIKDRMALATFQAQCHRQPRRGRDPGYNFTSPTLRDQQFPPQPGQWRKLVLVITPEVIRAYWDGDTSPFSNVLIKTLPTEIHEAFAALPMGLRSKTPPRFALRGGLGLVCNRGAALFRNVLITPLKEGP